MTRALDVLLGTLHVLGQKGDMLGECDFLCDSSALPVLAQV